MTHRWLLATSLTIAALSFAWGALARNQDGRWDNIATPPEVREWITKLMQPDNPSVSCCGEADAYYADSFEVEGDKYVAILTDEREVPGRQSLPVGTRIVVPNNKLKFDQGNPTGHGIIFLSIGSNYVYCYIAPGGV